MLLIKEKKRFRKKNIYNEFAQALLDAGFVMDLHGKTYKGYIISNRSIYGMFCRKHDNEKTTCPNALNGRFCADNIDSFSDWSRCPISVPIPKNKAQINLVIEKLRFLSTEVGLIASTNNIKILTSYDDFIDELEVKE